MPGNLSPKEKNLVFFQRELPKLIDDPAYKLKFVIVANEEIKGVYDTFSAALEIAAGTFSADEFVIQQVISEKDQINFLKAAI